MPPLSASFAPVRIMVMHRLGKAEIPGQYRAGAPVQGSVKRMAARVDCKSTPFGGEVRCLTGPPFSKWSHSTTAQCRRLISV